MLENKANPGKIVYCVHVDAGFADLSFKPTICVKQGILLAYAGIRNEYALVCTEPEDITDDLESVLGQEEDNTRSDGHSRIAVYPSSNVFSNTDDSTAKAQDLSLKYHLGEKETKT